MIDEKIKQLMQQHPDLFPTEAKFWSWLRGCLRRGIWERSPMKIRFKNEHCFPPPPHIKDTRAKTGTYCALSGEWEGKSKLEVDHTIGNIPFKSEEDIVPFLVHLLASGEEELQLVTKDAHKIKSYAERNNISYADAIIEKEVIKFCKLSATEQVKELKKFGLKSYPNQKGRAEEYRNYLKRGLM